MNTVALLETLSNAFGVSGFEDDVRETIRPLAADLADEVRTDVLGNLIATRRGRSPRTLMLDAHMDEIGFIVSHIEDSGFLRVAPIGSWDPRVLPAQAVTIRTRDRGPVRGVIGSLPPHLLSAEDRAAPIRLDALFIDVGADSAAAVMARGVRIGDPATLAYAFESLGDGCVLGKAFDDRVGCTVLLEVLRGLAGETPELTIACNFAVCEEVGLRGAHTAVYQIDPVLALALEGTVAADVPGVAGARRVTRLGGGPAISIADNRTLERPRVVRALERIAESHGIPYQVKAPGFGGTDAGAIHVSRAGVLAGGVSVPCRYIHTPLSLLKMSDVEGAARLVGAFAREAHTLLD